MVKAAIGQEVSHEDLGGARMHAAISGTIDFREPDEPTCLARLRRLVDALPADVARVNFGLKSARPAADLLPLFEGHQEYDMRDLLKCILDDAPFDGGTRPILAKPWYAATAASAASRWEWSPIRRSAANVPTGRWNMAESFTPSCVPTSRPGS